MKEVDGGGVAEGHPHPSTRLDHVSHGAGGVSVGCEGLAQGDTLVNNILPALPALPLLSSPDIILIIYLLYLRTYL